MSGCLLNSNAVISTPIGSLKIVEHDGAVIEIRETSRALEPPSTLLLQKACSEIEAYFDGRLKEFTFSVRLTGTDFRIAVWTACRNIPFGTTASYSQIAGAIGSPGSQRAVGTALGLNPLLLVVPCHRVVSKTSLGGFRLPLPTKKFLLNLEFNAKLPDSL